MNMTTKINKTKKNRQRAEFDSPWKQVLGHFFRPFMAFCLPELEKEIDWSKGYESLDKELHALLRDHKTGKLEIDKLIKVWLKKDHKEVWLLIHIELQAQKDSDFPERFCLYNCRLFDRHRHPIVSVAIFADGNL